MPPGPAYNWFCVLYSAGEILGHAARYRSAQVAPRTAGNLYPNPQKRRRTAEALEDVQPPTLTAVQHTPPLKNITRHAEVKTDVSRVEEVLLSAKVEITKEDAVLPISQDASMSIKDPHPALNEPENTFRDDTEEIRPSDVGKRALEAKDPLPVVVEAMPIQPTTRNLQSSKVPSSRIGRLFHYGGLAASLGYGAAAEVLRRTGSSGPEDQSSVMLTEANIKRLVSKLVQMRGAALKLGQFMSIQDTHILPPEIDKIFRRVQDSAHYMPDWQMEKVMTTSFGPDWSSNFASFERLPFAAASIGQVHNAILAASVSPTGKEEPVAVKIQFPNIVNSIESDLGYIKLLLTAGQLLPKGLFLDKTIQVMKAEMADECDYLREASFLRAFGSPEYLGNDPRYKVPWVWDGSTSTVLIMERVNGVSVGEATAQTLSQDDRNDISARIIELCLKELFHFRTMQTDPNWTNFLWNPTTRQIELVDFGATRVYTKEFMDRWLRLLKAASSDDREECVRWSLELGYLTGEENEIMLNAHVNSMTLLATPFKAETQQPFLFGKGSQWADITSEIRAQIPVMLQHRLTPPPQETYSLNRKLSGSFLLASRLSARIDTKAIWDGVIENYKFA